MINNGKNDGVQFAYGEYEKTLRYINAHPEYKHLRGKVLTEYRRVKTINLTGDLYQYYLKFKDGKNKHASEFAFLSTIGILTSEEMADYIKSNYANELCNVSEIADLKVGDKLTNDEISMKFACAYMGGMRGSTKNKCLVLIAKHDNPLYDDQWIENDDGTRTLHYTGKGKVGPQKLDGENKTLSESRTNGIKVYLFESYETNEYVYDGEVKLVADPYETNELGEDKIMRSVWKFPLQQVSDLPAIFDEASVKAADKEKEKEVKKESDAEVEEKAKAAGKTKPGTRIVAVTQVNRNPYVTEHVKRRAGGICDGCGKKAPFEDREGNPYLECHHVFWLANGGPDVIYNAVALCPNCHKRAHIRNKSDNKLLSKIEEYLNATNDNASLSEFNKMVKANKNLINNQGGKK